MRKFVIAALAVAALMAVSGVAYAVNVYTVTGTTQPRGKGKPKKPLPVSLNFDYTVADENPDFRGTPVEKYFIGAEGLVTYPELFPKCSGDSENANHPDKATAKARCKKARVGGGTVAAVGGAPTDQLDKNNCVLDLNLYNLKPGRYPVEGRPGEGTTFVKVSKKHGGLAIRLDGDQPAPPSLDPSEKGECAVPQHAAIIAPYTPVRIGGVRSDELRFTVPYSLLHLGGLDVVVRQVRSSIKKLTARKRIAGKRRKVGFYSAIGCKGRTRLLQATFVDEAGRPTKKTEQPARPC